MPLDTVEQTQKVDSEEAVADLPAALTLTATAGPCEGTTYAKAGLLLTVGRTRASKLHIKDSAVSEKHAELRWEGGNWNLADVGSSNGTAVNGKKLTEGIPVLLKDGDVILFGSDSLLTVQLTPAFGEQTTVEQHLRSECELLMQRVRAKEAVVGAGKGRAAFQRAAGVVEKDQAGAAGNMTTLCSFAR